MIGTALEQTGLGVTLFALAMIVHGVDLGDGHPVHLLDSSLDLKFVGLAVNDETVDVQFFALSRHFLGYDRLN